MAMKCGFTALGWGLGVLTTLLLVPACGQGIDDEMDKLVDIGSHSLHIRCVGNGRPTLAAAEHARQSTDPQERAKASYLDAVASELQMLFTETAEQVVAIASFDDLPLTVMAAGKANPAFGGQAEAFQQFWIEQCRALALKSANGTFVLVEESGHHLEQDAPDAVIRAIGEMMARVRA